MKQQALKGFEIHRDRRDEAMLTPMTTHNGVESGRGIALAIIVLAWFRQQHFLYRLSRLEYGLFEAQTRFSNADEFGDWLKIGIGWCVWAPGPNGGIVPIPKSLDGRRLPVSKSALDDLYNATVNFVSSDQATRFLWPGAFPQDRACRAAQILKRFA